MVGLDDQRLSAWVLAWAGEYADGHDERFADLWEREWLDRSSMDRLIEWKFVAMPHRRSRTHRALANESDQAIADVTSAARRCADDGAALRVVRVLNGVGPALGSAALMAMDASRWTVLDVRALASIRGRLLRRPRPCSARQHVAAVPRRVSRPRAAHEQRSADGRSCVVRRERP